MSMDLPIYEIIPDIKSRLQKQNTLILQAPPGAGKSTVLPLELLNEPWLEGQKILMLEPRRLAARAVAARLAQLHGSAVGQTVGYRVRFENKTSADTRIEILTEGILTRMLQQDNALEGVGMVIFDEFHERSLQADLALALCRESQQILREDLRILIMSATLNGEQLSRMLGNASIVTSKGRQYPITHKYVPQDDHLHLPVQVARTVRKAMREEEGDLLVFLPGAGEIKRTAELLEAEGVSAKLFPLYGDLTPREQQQAITPDPEGRRKVVLATSIAETSLTIEGIKVVVDSGFARMSRFDPRSGLSRLETVRVTLDAADQRAGRAGRLGPGVCYRMWSEGSHHHLQPQRKPEILEADLAPTVLELANWGVQEIRSLSWLTPPPQGAVAQAQTLLQELEALEEGRITAKGKEMLRLPTHPRLAHMLLVGEENGITALAADVAALLEEKDPLPRDSGADLSMRVDTLRKWRSGERVNAERGLLDRIEKLASNWRRLFRTSEDNKLPPAQETGLLIAAAYPERVAKRTEQEGRYRLANARSARLPEVDALAREEWLAIALMDAGTKEGKIFLAAPLDAADLMHLAHEQDVLSWDERQGVLLARRERRLGNILVDSKPLQNIPPEEQQKALCEAVRLEGINILPWSEENRQWQARVMSLRTWRPEEEWPDVSDEHLLETVEDWLPPYLQGIRKRDDFKKLDLKGILTGLLPWPLPQRLDTLAPETIHVPSGSEIKLQYFPEANSPVLAVRLQEMFGLLDTPAVNEGRTKVMLHLLSPGFKPVQVTQDLRSFWQNTYQEVRKELRIRYSKHSWPEDPWTAEAVRGAKRRKPME